MIQIHTTQHFAHIRAPFRLKDICRQLPGAQWQPLPRVWRIPATPHAALQAWTMLVNEEINADERFWALCKTAADGRVAAKHRTQECPPVPGEITPSWRHQRQAYWFAEKQQAAFLAMHMGTGKSLVAINLMRNTQARRVLVLCPVSVLGVWPQQMAMHDGQMHVEVLNQQKTVQYRCQQAESACRRSESVMLICNYEAAWRQPLRDFLLQQQWDWVVLDESHRIKDPKGKASIFAAELRLRATRRLCLTGTPMPHSPLDVFAQMRFLDPGLLGTSYFAFRNRYAVMGGFNGKQVIGFQQQDALREKLAAMMYRAPKDVLDLPELLDEQRSVTLEPRSQRIYTELAAGLKADLEAGTVTPANALVRLLRLQQVTSGHVTNDADEVLHIGNAKEQALSDILKDLDEPVVVFCRFRHDLLTVETVAEVLRRPYRELSGRRKNLEQWQGEEAPSILGVQIQSGGLGVDLTRARVAIYYSMGFSLGDYLQSRDRIHRPGQGRNVLYLHLVATGTIDEVVYKALAKRQDVVNQVLAAL